MPVPRVQRLLTLLIPLSAFYMGLFLFQVTFGRGSVASVAGWSFMSTLLLFGVLAALLANFRRLVITTTPQLVSVRFGIFSHQVQWRDVSDCFVNESDMLRQSYSGVCVRRYRGRWQMSFTVADNPVVRLKKRNGIFKELVFSTNNPLRVKLAVGRPLSGYSANKWTAIEI